MLLAIADFADDAGRAYPSVSTLATKCRMSTRNAQLILAALKDSGELDVRPNEGPKGCNLYRLRLDGQPLKPASPLKSFSPLKHASPPEAPFTLKPASRGGEAGFAEGVKPTSPEPSLNRQEPSVRSPRAPGRRLPACPYQAIVDHYHAELPELPKVKMLGAKGRRQKIQAFWTFIFVDLRSDGTPRAMTAEEALDWTQRYFQRARQNDFVMGRTQRSAGHEHWQADLDYLMSERGRIQVIEKTKADQ
jgi:hypothetical protein